MVETVWTTEFFDRRFMKIRFRICCRVPWYLFQGFKVYNDHESSLMGLASPWHDTIDTIDRGLGTIRDRHFGILTTSVHKLGGWGSMRICCNWCCECWFQKTEIDWTYEWQNGLTLGNTPLPQLVCSGMQWARKWVKKQDINFAVAWAGRKGVSEVPARLNGTCESPRMCMITIYRSI